MFLTRLLIFLIISLCFTQLENYGLMFFFIPSKTRGFIMCYYGRYVSTTMGLETWDMCSKYWTHSMLMRASTTCKCHPCHSKHNVEGRGYINGTVVFRTDIKIELWDIHKWTGKIGKMNWFLLTLSTLYSTMVL